VGQTRRGPEAPKNEVIVHGDDMRMTVVWSRATPPLLKKKRASDRVEQEGEGQGACGRGDSVCRVLLLS